ncbi:neurophysin 1-like [Atheta coriaria]|uniref:neurophysin 1-like n=1 Tax=Dalotia coriaria TaxID=877792 RepID=UPI0031F40BD2
MFSKCFVLLAVLLALGQLIQGCLITNCPRGGKRSGKFLPETNVKPCVSCGPAHSGQCFGPNICCGPFGCLLGTPETARCQRDGMFMEREPCIAGSATCRRNTGRCAADGICCSQDACYADKSCSVDTRYDVYNFVNAEYTA